MSVPEFHIEGNLAAAPEIKQGNKGPWAVFTIITTTRRFNRQSNQWEDGDKASFRCTAFGDWTTRLNALPKGCGVIAVGRYRDRQYQDQQGQTRYSSEFIVYSIGPNVRSMVVGQVSRPQGSNGFAGAPRNQSQTATQSGNPWDAPQQPIPGVGGDPWAQAQADQTYGRQFDGDGNEPEF